MIRQNKKEKRKIGNRKKKKDTYIINFSKLKYNYVLKFILHISWPFESPIVGT